MIRRVSSIFAHAALRCLNGDPLPVVFIIGHMRCGSTLLMHLLLTNPSVIGCGERNAPYRSAWDLDGLEIAARIAQRAPFRRVRYVIDQINHDRFTPNLELLRDERLRFIFLIRNPGETIRSIVNLTDWTTERSVDYYSRRLRSIADYASSMARPSAAMALTYDGLLANTSAVLRRLEAFLGLDEQLSEKYTIQSFTGLRGDPSPNIRAGRILRDRVTLHVEIPDCELDRARHAYEACVHDLKADGVGALTSLSCV
jgi:hypothetical protein